MKIFPSRSPAHTAPAAAPASGNARNASASTSAVLQPSAGKSAGMGRISHALRGLKRCLRPAAINVMSVPGFTKTTIDPLPIPKRPPPPSLGKTPRPAGQHKLDAIDRQVHNLTAKLYPPLPTGTRADPEAKRAIGGERAFASAVEALFVPSGASVEAKAETAPHLHNLLRDLTRIAEAQPDAADSTRYAGMLQCARALAAATAGNAADACAALGHLRTHFSLTDGSDNAPLSPEQKHAWSAAKLLAHTASGFDALLALRPALAEVDAARPDDGMNHRMKREGLRTFLQAADHLAAHMPADTPGALLERARSHLARASDRRSLAGDGLAVHALLCAADLHADPGKAAHAIGDRTQVAAYVAWRSGYREGGKGSALERSLERMNKFTAWARRAEHRANHRLAAFDPRRLLGMRKTPVIAAAYGTGGANLGLLNGESKALYDTVQDGIAAMLAHSAVLRRLDGGHALPTERRGLLLLREVVLEHWRAQIGTTWRSSKLKLTRADKQDIKRAVRSAAHGTDIDAEAVLGYREFRKLDKLDLKTLAKWIDEAASADPDPSVSPMLRRAKAKIVEAGDIARGRPIKLKGTTLADFRDAMTDAIGTMPLGNYVRYFDGGTYGLNANMTVNQHAFTHNSPVPAMGLGPGAKALHGRHAFVEIGSSSYGGEVFIGTDKRSSTGAGLGAYAGLKFGTEDWHLSAGFSAGVAHSHDRSAPAGVIIRTGLSYGADGKATSAWRDNVAEVTRFLFQTAALGQSTRPVPPERMWEQFAERFFRTPDISVNWRDQRRSSETVTKHGSGAVRVAAGPVRLGPAFSVGHDQVLASKNDRVDTNGWLRGVERARARASNVHVSASLAALAPAVGHFSNRSGFPDSITLPSTPIVGLSANILPSGTSVTLRRVDEHGRLNPRFIRRLVEFIDPSAFLSHMQARMPRIARTDASREKVGAFMSAMKDMGTQGNLAYGESWKIRPEVTEVLNAYTDEIQLILKCAREATPRDAGTQAARTEQVYQGVIERILEIVEGEAAVSRQAQTQAIRQVLAGLGDQDVDQVLRLANETIRVLKDEQSWKLSGYYAYDITTHGYTAGPAMLLQATASTSVAGERVLAELAVRDLELLDDPVVAEQDKDPAAGEVL
ncbi:hypothetical protein RSP822_17340 [Ralstonia solanacearum]|uniref:hypothetical protein n=1 Tax=Ralstonia solanacearum TaxID=305 RepID=UPI000E663F43|nr:hypothetical protein [Ralstonia solanacearum]RIJ85131.1 hypothetical protein RSP822_17340 [Ralstonia solanacearum]